jgi:hypothetical protein
VVLLLRGFLQGQSSAQLSRELGLAYKTVLKWRWRVQANAQRLQPDTPLPDNASESDEMFQNGGKKGSNTSTRSTHRVGGRISGADAARLAMTVHLSWGR